MFANVNLAMGQNMSRWIELTVTPGQQIQLDFAADTANTQVKVVSGTKDTTLTVGTSWTDLINYYAQAGTMRLYGNINKLDCGGNNSKITGLDVSNNSGLIELRCSANELSSLNLTNLTALLEFYCQNNKLSSLDLTNLTALAYLECFNNNLSSIKISGCESLCYISCRGNNLSACGLDSLFHQLSRRAEDNKGKIYIQNGIYGTNPGALTCRDTIATNRNWEVLDIDGDIPIVNTTYGCPDFSIIEEMSANSLGINIYPNPASNNLNIECGEKINNLELYDAVGRMLISKENVLDNTSIDVSNLDSGMYILKIRTGKGSGEYKIIIE